MQYPQLNQGKERKSTAANEGIVSAQFLDMFAAIASGRMGSVEAAELIQETLEFMVGQAGANGIMVDSPKFRELLNGDDGTGNAVPQPTTPTIATMSLLKRQAVKSLLS